jgi:hypothetical protein
VRERNARQQEQQFFFFFYNRNLWSTLQSCKQMAANLQEMAAESRATKAQGPA